MNWEQRMAEKYQDMDSINERLDELFEMQVDGMVLTDLEIQERDWLVAKAKPVTLVVDKLFLDNR